VTTLQLPEAQFTERIVACNGWPSDTD